jgi:glycosidase
VRYGAPRMNWFSNGHDVNEMNQIWAAGHSLALCSNWPGTFVHENAATIRRLVALRRQFSNALIEGIQEYQPATGSESVVAYLYRGARDVVLVVVNTASGGSFAGDVALRDSEAGSRWQVLAGSRDGDDTEGEDDGDTTCVHDRTKLRVTIPAGELRVFVKR